MLKNSLCIGWRLQTKSLLYVYFSWSGFLAINFIPHQQHRCTLWILIYDKYLLCWYFIIRGVALCCAGSRWFHSSIQFIPGLSQMDSWVRCTMGIQNTCKFIFMYFNNFFNKKWIRRSFIPEAGVYFLCLLWIYVGCFCILHTITFTLNCC